MSDFSEEIFNYTKNNLVFIQDYFKLIHAQNILGMFLVFLLGLASGKGIGGSNKTILLGFFIIFFSYSFCSIVNDICDVKIDKINSPNRPLPSGRIKIMLAKWLAIVNVAAMALFGIIGGENFLIFAMLMLIIGGFYSLPRLKRLSDKSFAGWFLLIMAYYILPYFLGLPSFHNFKMTDSLILSVLVCVGGAKLLLKDFRDEKGDREFKKITPLILLGKKKLFSIIYILTIAGFIAMVLFLRKMSFNFYIYAIVFVYFIMYLMSLQGIYNSQEISKKNRFALAIGRLNLLLIVIFLFFI